LLVCSSIQRSAYGHLRAFAGQMYYRLHSMKPYPLFCVLHGRRRTDGRVAWSLGLLPRLPSLPKTLKRQIQHRMQLASKQDIFWQGPLYGPEITRGLCTVWRWKEKSFVDPSHGVPVMTLYRCHPCCASPGAACILGMHIVQPSATHI
jgi:hypothetical protein